MAPRTVQYWCDTCDEPGWMCRRRKGHVVREVVGDVVRDDVARCQARREGHTHQFTPANDATAAQWFAVMHEQLK